MNLVYDVSRTFGHLTDSGRPPPAGDASPPRRGTREGARAPRADHATEKLRLSLNLGSGAIRYSSSVGPVGLSARPGFRRIFRIIQVAVPNFWRMISEIGNAASLAKDHFVRRPRRSWTMMDNGKDRNCRMTGHAEARCRQRGIKSESVDLIVANGDREHHAGAGCTAISLSRSRMTELQAEGVPASVIDQAAGTVLIVGHDGAIVTVMNRPTWFARFHYGAERCGPRRRLRGRGRRSRGR